MRISRGFTLIELMIVIAIVGILASIAMPSYRSYVQQATVSKAFSAAQGIKTQIVEQFTLTGTLPAAGTEYFRDDSADADIHIINWQTNLSANRIVVDFGPGSGTLEDKRLWFVLDTSNPTLIKWDCTNHSNTNSGVPVDALPSECQ